MTEQRLPIHSYADFPVVTDLSLREDSEEERQSASTRKPARGQGAKFGTLEKHEEKGRSVKAARSGQARWLIGPFIRDPRKR